MSSWRQDFPIFKKLDNEHKVYLDSAATSQKPLSMIETMNTFYSQQYATVHRGIYSLSEEATYLYEQSRKQIAAYLNAGDQEIVFTKGTTESINLLAHCLKNSKRITTGDSIWLTPVEHHANLLPWQRLAKEVGASLKFIPIDADGNIEFEKWHLDTTAKLVTLSHISNVTGSIHPIEKIVTLAKSVGALVAIDGAQSAPVLEIDVKKMDIDFYSFSGHKVYGPNGIGILWGRLQLLEQFPPYQLGGHMIDKVELTGCTYGPVPSRFEAGTPMIAEVIALASSIKYLVSQDRNKIFKHDQSLINMCLEHFSSNPLIKVIGKPQQRAGICSFSVKGIHPLDLATFLDLEGVMVRCGHLCAQPALKHFGVDSLVRVSVALYNNVQDIQVFLNHLDNVIKKLK